MEPTGWRGVYSIADTVPDVVVQGELKALDFPAHELRIVSERTKSWKQTVKMSFFPRREIRVETQRWFRNMIRIPPWLLPLEVFRVHPTGRRPRGKPRWRD